MWIKPWWDYPVLEVRQQVGMQIKIIDVLTLSKLGWWTGEECTFNIGVTSFGCSSYFVHLFLPYGNLQCLWGHRPPSSAVSKSKQDLCSLGAVAGEIAPFRIPVLRLWGREEGLGVEGEVEELGHELKLTEGFSEFPPAFKIDRICEIQNANGESEVSPDLIKFDNLAFALCQKAGSLIRSGETSGNSEKSHRINFLTSFLSTEQPPPTRIPTTW